MKRILSLVLPFVLAVTLGAVAQTDTTPSPSSTNQATTPDSSSSTQSNSQTQSSTSSSQTNTGSSSTMAQSGTTSTSSPSMEGCIVRHETDYFLQPETGQPVKLNSSQDLSQHVGHRVRVEGTMNQAGSSTAASNTGANTSGTYGNPGTSSSTNSAGSTAGNSADQTSNQGQSASSSSATGQTQEILVTKVDMISETCPSGMQNQSAQPNSESPKQ